MTTIAIDPEVFDGLSDVEDAALRSKLGVPVLGEPAIWEDEDGKIWWIFDDHRISNEGITELATVIGDPSQLLIPEEESP